MKKYNDQVMKFTTTKDKLKMEISISDLVQLFNGYAEEQDCQLKRGVRQEFVEMVAELLQGDSSTGSNDAMWEEMFNGAFDYIIENESELLKVEDEF